MCEVAEAAVTIEWVVADPAGGKRMTLKGKRTRRRERTGKIGMKKWEMPTSLAIRHPRVSRCVDSRAAVGAVVKAGAESEQAAGVRLGQVWRAQRPVSRSLEIGDQISGFLFL